MPSCQIRRPLGVSHSTVPIRSADPSDSSNSPRTVPVPNVVTPTTRPAGVLQRAGDDLGGARGVRVDEDDQRQVQRDAVGRDRVVGLVAVGVALDVDVARCVMNWLAMPVGLVDVAARVAAQVEDEPVGAGLLDRLERLDHVVGGAVRERRGGAGPSAARDERPRDGLDRDVGPVDRVGAGRAIRAGADGEVDRRAGLAADPAGDLVDVVAGGRLAVDASR